ncbi:Na(+)/H(+) antiporter subunit D, partial [Shewanella sp. 10N.286.52.E4]
RSTHLDVDWVYRRLVPNALQRVFAVIWKVDGDIRQSVRGKLDQCQKFLSRQNKGGAGSFISSDYPSGNMVLWVAVILATYLFIGFVS